MSEFSRRPVAFYHQDGLVAAWNHAARYAGSDGRIATLPEIVQLRLSTEPNHTDSPWENWYTSASAEYVGIGADGRIKIIVAHGVGPMATIDGIKAAYKWEYGDKSRQRNGGRITAQQFLDLEAGVFGEATTFDFEQTWNKSPRALKIAPVNILDFQDYVDYLSQMGEEPFMQYQTAIRAQSDPLLRLRLGANAVEYLRKHARIAREFHANERPNDRYTWAQGFDDRESPYITKVESAPNCSYMVLNTQSREDHGRWLYEPRVPESGYALAHLLDVDRLTHTTTSGVGVMLMSAPGVHEWWNNAKFVAVPPEATLDEGLLNGPDAATVLSEHWEHFAEPVEEGYIPIEPFHLVHAAGEWFAQYPKKLPKEQCMDEGDLEFHVRSVDLIDGVGTFTTDEMFFLRYKLSQVKNIMPSHANGYRIIDVSSKDNRGLSTVTVQFYRADVDISRRLPRVETIARDYDKLMEVYAH